jgi:AAA15 family ATPase/GTPase
MIPILKDLEIYNFKKFEHLSVKNMGQVNLVTGDNNVGKTTFLESLLFSEDNLKWISSVHHTLCFRNIHIHPEDRHSKNIKFPEISFLNYALNNIAKPLIYNYKLSNNSIKNIELQHLTIDKLTDEIKELRKDNYDFTNLKDWVLFSKNGVRNELQWLYVDDFDRNFQYGYWPFVGFNISYGRDLHGFVKELDGKLSELDYNVKQRIIELLKIFIPNILDYELRKFGSYDLIGIASETDPNYIPLTQYGDGVQKFFRYIVEILYAQSQGENRIMIDEIDTGVHYLKLPEMWAVIFKLAQETGVQIFATTHSSDCIKSFVEAGQNSIIKDDIRLIELEEFTTKSGQIKQVANAYDLDTLAFKIQTETNVRGGNVWQ